MKKVLATLLLAACGGGDDGGNSASPDASVTPPMHDAPAAPDTTALLHAKIDTIVVIFAENRGFDNIYGTFPNAKASPASTRRPRARSSPR